MRAGAARVGDTVQRRGAVREEHAAACDAVDDRARDGWIERRAAEAAPEPAATLRAERRAHVIGGMDHDAALEGAIVHAGLESVELERVSVLTRVGVAGEERAAARAMALGVVAEAHQAIGIGLARRSAPVRDEFVEQHASRVGFDHPEPRLRRRHRVVDHGEDGVADLAGVGEPPVGGERALEQVAAREGVAVARQCMRRDREEREQHRQAERRQPAEPGPDRRAGALLPPLVHGRHLSWARRPDP